MFETPLQHESPEWFINIAPTSWQYGTFDNHSRFYKMVSDEKLRSQSKSPLKEALEIERKDFS